MSNISYIKQITRFYNDNGYVSFLDREHPLSSSQGKVYYHRHVMSLHIDRWLESHEYVHHIDGDRSNNNIENLKLTNSSEHAREHIYESMNVIPIKERECLGCGKVFLPDHDRIKHCSFECAHPKIFDPSKEELQEMVWKMPTTDVAKYYRVSDVAVAKRCKKLGVNKPPRGYWQKLAANS